MRFDYRIAKEATFNDWVNDGVDKARLILKALEEPHNEKHSETNEK